ncbi:unnamed protein product, partial [Staurois parvus]
MMGHYIPPTGTNDGGTIPPTDTNDGALFLPLTDTNDGALFLPLTPMTGHYSFHSGQQWCTMTQNITLGWSQFNPLSQG